MGQTYLSADTRERIQDLIKQRPDMTQAKLAGMLGISESTLSRFLSGETSKFAESHIIQTAKIFNVSTDFLLGETNIPDRKNYDIEELGLSAGAAKALYTGQVNTQIVSQLLENPHFAMLTNMLAKYQDETFITGMMAMNQNIDYLRSFILGQKSPNPDDKEAAHAVADELQALKVPATAVDTTAIQNLFNQVVRDIRKNAESHAAEHKAATKETLDQFYKALKKGQDDPNIKSITPEQTTEAILAMVPEGTFSEEKLQSLESALTAIFTEAKDSAHEP
ncbi:MAG: helix-turn-helix transcriptional regulator [Eubacteriales bacterium]|nr:helix-turn-helix transcriptional regulator [Eubacteriales bacterium]